MVSSSESEKSVGGLLGGVCSNGFSDPEWLFVLVVVESTRNVASSLTGSVCTDLDGISSSRENWLIKSIASMSGAGKIRFASARVIGRQLDIHSLKFVVYTQIHQACQKCYRVREQGVRTEVKVGWRRHVNCAK